MSESPSKKRDRSLAAWADAGGRQSVTPTLPYSKPSLPSPEDVLRRVLPSGITVLARENWSAPSVVVEGYLQVGNLDAPETPLGLASFANAMLTRGTRTRTFAEINETIESVGASVGFSTDHHITSFSTKSLVEDLDLVLAILADELRNPVFPVEYIDRMRGLRMTALAERENSTRQMAGRALRELMFGDHPLGRDLLGTRDSLQAINREALVRFHEEYYSPQGMVVAVVGALPAEKAVQRVEAAFEGWERSRAPRADLPPLARLDGIRSRQVSLPGKSQSDMMLGWPSMRRLDPDFDAARLANTVLGVFGMMGRLGASVRERQGMAYYAYSRLAADREPGTWVAIAGVNPANVERTRVAMLEETKLLRDHPVPADELEDCKRFLTGSLPLQLETNDGVASLLVDLEWHELGLDYLERYTGIINGLTAEQVQKVAQKYLDPEAYVFAVAGPEVGS